MKTDSNASWNVGVLFSTTGVTEVTETEHLRGTLLALDEINRAGGVLGRPVQPIIYDPGVCDATYRTLARRLLREDEVSVIFGGSMSASRKAILPILERNNGLLFYPSMYEGFEYSENVLYGGATLNQNTVALADYLLAHHGRRIFLIGADYIYPRESNRVMRELVEAKGGEVVAEHYVPLQADAAVLAEAIDAIVRTGPDTVFSTVVGEPARLFYRLYAESGIDRRRCPIASLTMAESEMRLIGPELCSGHILSASYLQTVSGETNARFVAAFRSRYGESATPSVWSEPAYNQVHLFAQGLAQAASLDPARLSEAILQQELDAPEGRVGFDADTRHIWLTPRIGVQRGDGQFDVAWEASRPIKPDPYLAVTRFEDRWIGA